MIHQLQQRLRPFALLTTGLAVSLLVGCGNAPLQTTLQTTPQTDQFAFVQTVDIGSNDTVSSIESATQGKVVSWQPEAGFAILGMQALTPAPKATTSATAPITITVPSSNTGVLTIAEGSRAWGSGSRAWGSGSRAWGSGGLVNAFLGSMEQWNSGWLGNTNSITTYSSASAANMFPFTGKTTSCFTFCLGSGGINLGNGQNLASNLGKGIKVAIIDTGVDLKHPGLKGDAYQPSHLAPATDWKDFVDGDNIPQEVKSLTANNEGYGHGTGVAGLVLQVAPYASIMPIRVLAADGTGDSSNAVKAIEWAVNRGAKVINLSLGTIEPSEELRRMVIWASSKGVFTVTAAGNNDTTSAMYPAAYATQTANGGDRMISVGSIGSFNTNDWLTNKVLGDLGLSATNFDLKSPVSVYGKNVELFAPGELLSTLLPEGQVGQWTGTSFATPLVSGTIALALGQPLTATQLSRVSTAITSTAEPIGLQNPTLTDSGTMKRLNVFKFLSAVLAK
jgi:thermitase